MGNPFCHIELNTDDVGTAKKFYKKVFDWQYVPMQPDYVGINVGKGTGGGMMKKPMPEAPSHWLPYVEVESVKKTMAKAIKNGARGIVEFMPIGEMGAIGVFSDPSGATIGIWEAAKKPAKGAKKSAKKAAKKGAKKTAKKK